MASEQKLDSVVREIIDHLSFLGYESEVHDGAQHPYVFLQHKSNPNYIIDTSHGLLLCKSYFGASELAKSQPPEFFHLLNELNREFTVLRVYYLEDGRIVLESYFPHGYSKTSFANFWGRLEYDSKLFMDGRTSLFIE